MIDPNPSARKCLNAQCRNREDEQPFPDGSFCTTCVEFFAAADGLSEASTYPGGVPDPHTLCACGDVAGVHRIDVEFVEVAACGVGGTRDTIRVPGLKHAVCRLCGCGRFQVTSCLEPV